MSWFADILGNWKNEKTDDYLSFGRFSDAYKAQDNYQAWDGAMEAFEDGQILEAYRLFFDYLKNAQDNLSYQQEQEELKFCLFQGSKQIVGHIGQDMVWAEAKIARTQSLEMGFLRLLVEKNYGLKYSRFALDGEDNITIVFDSHRIDCSPFKLYFALKELSITADKLDDIMIDEWRDDLEQINTGHVTSLDPAVVQNKITFLRQQLQKAIEYFQEHSDDPSRSPGGLSYYLLSTCYRIDYLTQPEAYVLEAIERIQRMYFSRSDLSMDQKNHQIIKEFELILERDDETMAREFYQSVFTFGITKPAGQFELEQLFHQDWNNLIWYLNHDLEEVSLATAEYIVGYSLFNFAPPQVIRELLHLFYEIVHNVYFNAIGYDDHYYSETSREFKERAIRKSINGIERRYKEQLEELDIDVKSLDYTTLPRFAATYLEMINKLKID